MIPTAILPWRRALPPAEPPLAGMVTLLFPPHPREPELDVKPDDGPALDPVVFGSVPRVSG